MAQTKGPAETSPKEARSEQEGQEAPLGRAGGRHLRGAVLQQVTPMTRRARGDFWSEAPQERAWGGGVGTREGRVRPAVIGGPLPLNANNAIHLGSVAARVPGSGKSSRTVLCSSDGFKGSGSGDVFFWRASAILRHISQGYSPLKVISAASLRLRSCA